MSVVLDSDQNVHIKGLEAGKSIVIEHQGKKLTITLTSFESFELKLQEKGNTTATFYRSEGMYLDYIKDIEEKEF